MTRFVGLIVVAFYEPGRAPQQAAGRAHTHLWKGETMAIDLRRRAIVAQWANGCSGSRGIALDEARGFLFVGCAEGRAIVLDVDRDGRAHLYVPTSRSATLTILGVSSRGALSVLGSVPVARGSHGATTDGNGRVFVGDPGSGRLLVIDDPFLETGR